VFSIVHKMVKVLNSSLEAATLAAEEAAAFEHLLAAELAVLNPHLNSNGEIDLIYSYVLPSVALIGVLANILSFSAWYSRQSPLSQLLQWLATYDIGVATLAVVIYSLLNMITGGVRDLEAIIAYYCLNKSHIIIKTNNNDKIAILTYFVVCVELRLMRYYFKYSSKS